MLEELVNEIKTSIQVYSDGEVPDKKARRIAINKLHNTLVRCFQKYSD